MSELRRVTLFKWNLYCSDRLAIWMCRFSKKGFLQTTTCEVQNSFIHNLSGQNILNQSSPCEKIFYPLAKDFWNMFSFISSLSASSQYHCNTRCPLNRALYDCPYKGLEDEHGINIIHMRSKKGCGTSLVSDLLSKCSWDHIIQHPCNSLISLICSLWNIQYGPHPCFKNRCSND